MCPGPAPYGKLYDVASGGATAEPLDDEAVGRTGKRVSTKGATRKQEGSLVGAQYRRKWSCISGLSAGASRRARFWHDIESMASGLRIWLWTRHNWYRPRRPGPYGGSWDDRFLRSPCHGSTHGGRGDRYDWFPVSGPRQVRGRINRKKRGNIRTVEPLGAAGALIGASILVGAEMPREMVGALVDALTQGTDMSGSGVRRRCVLRGGRVRDGRRCSRGVGAACGLALAIVVVWSRSGFRSGAGPGALHEGPALELVRLGLERGRGQVGAGGVAQDVDAGLLGGHEWRAILLLLTVAGGEHRPRWSSSGKVKGARWAPGGRLAGQLKGGGPRGGVRVDGGVVEGGGWRVDGGEVDGGWWVVRGGAGSRAVVGERGACQRYLLAPSAAFSVLGTSAALLRRRLPHQPDGGGFGEDERTEASHAIAVPTDFLPSLRPQTQDCAPNIFHTALRAPPLPATNRVSAPSFPHRAVADQKEHQ